MAQKSLVSGGNAWKIVGGAVVGAAGGLVGTAVLLRSVEAGILAAIGGAIVAMIAAGMTFERAEA